MDPLVWIAGLPGGGRRVWLDPAGLMDLAWLWQAFLDDGCPSLFQWVSKSFPKSFPSLFSFLARS
jgi:hypothetical protein